MDVLPLIQISGLEIHRGNRLILSNFDFELNEGELVSLVGSNGCGKTTLLESSAGMHTISSGSIFWKYDELGLKLVRASEGRRNSLPPMGLTLQKNGMSGEETVLERLRQFYKFQVVILIALKHQNCLIVGLNHRSGDRISQLSGGLG